MARERIASDRKRAGRPICHVDALVAAMARLAAASLATRNVADFEGCGMTLRNPGTATTDYSRLDNSLSAIRRNLGCSRAGPAYRRSMSSAASSASSAASVRSPLAWQTASR